MKKLNNGCARCRAPLPILFECIVTGEDGVTVSDTYCRPCVADLRGEGYAVAVDTTDRDAKYAEAFAPIADADLGPLAQWLAPWHLQQLRELVTAQRREAFLKGWHQCRCEVDEDEAEGRCSECNAGPGEAHGEWCCHRESFTGYTAAEEEETDPRDYASEV